MTQRYDIAFRKGGWWVIGHMEANIWLPIRGPRKTKLEAERDLQLQLQADRNLISCLDTWNMKDPASAYE